VTKKREGEREEREIKRTSSGIAG